MQKAEEAEGTQQSCASRKTDLAALVVRICDMELASQAADAQLIEARSELDMVKQRSAEEAQRE